MVFDEEKAYDKLVAEYEILRKAILENNVNITKRIINDLNIDKELVVNFAPKEDNSLLFIACQNGYLEQVNCLIGAGAKCTPHKSTKCTPLYAAIRGGHISIVKILLSHFPDAINVMTSENWSPLHVACINGKNDVVDLLLAYQFSRDLLHKYRLGDWEYECAFDPNQLDNFNQTPLYIACLSGNDYIIESLLNWRLICTHSTKQECQMLLSPIDLNVQCAFVKETALMAAVRGGFLYIVSILLRNGINPNIYNSNLIDDIGSDDCSGNSVLIEAVRQKSFLMTELLLRFGAKDTNSCATKIACVNADEDLVHCLLARHSHEDPEHKLNETDLLTGCSNLGQTLPSYCNTYCNLFPTNPTVIDWSFTNCHLQEIKIKWLIAAVANINPKLKTSSTLNQISLGAITRIDISHNSLTLLPPEIFSMCSLTYLNAAQNKIEQLPSPTESSYNSPVLEEIYLQDNCLEEVLPEIFRLPSLVTLDISNNKLQKIPFDMWKSPKLRELNIAFNLLKDLPTSEDSNSPTIFKYKSPGLKTISHRPAKNELIHQNIWSKSLEIVDRDTTQFSELRGSSALRNLNLSNNLFTSIPPALPCLAENLSRLNMSYNSLRSMGHVTSYPVFLRQLDLSHNEISCWPSLVTVNSGDPYLACYNDQSGNSDKFNSSNSNAVLENPQTDVYHNLCCHKKHLRLESLKTLILADNALTKIQLSTDDITTFSETEETEFGEFTNIGVTKLRLIYPNLSMLDISNNCLKEVPQFLHKLTNLSILNISGNVEITELPANMGLLYRLWNLNTKGCSLQGYLNTMIESKKFKTMEIIGYLKSIYEDAKPYARMKLMVVGKQGIGKTSILELLREMYPNQNKKILGDHWTKRMGATTANSKKKNYNISTVGVDIGDLVCEEKKKNGGSLYGPVVFRTWDFGGQKEYYATHQYFLSKRSLYLVVWRIDEGKNGLIEVLQWLGNIQARAPNSPVLIVGTHHDNVGTNISEAEAISLQQYIRERFIAVTDSEKIGLPKVMSSIEISCKNHYNVRELGSLIYDTVFSLKSPGSKELLLHQNVPASYLALEDVVGNISTYLKQVGSDPVLNFENLKQMVYQEMHFQNFKSFRDTAELHQAVLFLHENGVLLHYNDSTLRDFYFLDPQWLCDMLAQVVTIKEINPFVKNGVMKIDDINQLIKTNTQTSTDRKYILSLLNKFEVALTWDLRTLLIPSLLPLTEDEPENTITLKVVSKSPKRKMSTSESNHQLQTNSRSSDLFGTEYKPLSRLLLISYFPSGFWSRLMIRILADNQIGEIAQNIYKTPPDVSLANKTHWKLWQTGMELYVENTLIFKLREISLTCLNSPYRNELNKFKIKQDGIWSDIDLSRSSILEINFPLLRLMPHTDDDGCDAHSIGIPPNIQGITKLLSACVDHVDILLEDWYPTIGTRFVHTSEGRFLVTRLVPCPVCIERTHRNQMKNGSITATSMNGSFRQSKENLLDGPSNGIDDKSYLHTTIWNYLWTIEECVLSTYDKKVLVCPIHGDVSVTRIAPDLMFLDLNGENLIEVNEINKGNLIGRGAFGFVFKATLHKATDEPRSVAMKMLQPVQPGIRAGKSALMAYKAALEKWRRDPLENSCKAYFTARQELTVMLNLRHSNIMSLIGVCMQPLALILDCAPKGALDTMIQKYRRNGSRIGPYCFQLIVLQTSRAIEYLHRSHIIYRDLKAENVLVWKIPEPNETDSPSNPVHIKIADYGISRISLPTGTKGFGGTEGFMAPEIICHNGEEEYTEKVDCFSFGMLIYELITLRQPFEGHETVKESILEGSRPVFTSREVMFPSYCLDLMVLCWDHQPKNRPSASQIVSIACAPEFTHLIDVILLPHGDEVKAMVTLNNQKFQRENSFKLWISIERCVETITGFEHGWISYQRYQPSQVLPTKGGSIPSKMTAMCSVKLNTIWFGDNRGSIHSYNESQNTCAFSYELDGAAVIKIECIAGTNFVAAALENGHIYILDSTCYPIKCTNDKDDFIIAEASINSKLSSMTTYCNSSRSCTIWCGHSYGKLTVFEFKLDTFESRQFNLQHVNCGAEISVSILATSQNSIYSYPSPGCILYQWSTLSKKLINQLDCLKLVPCSESLGSIAIDKALSVGRCQITAVCVLNNNIYVGTSWGCLIVAENTTLTPITVFRPYEEEVQYIAVVPSECSLSTPVILSVGKGYRSLINRYTDVDPSKSKEKKNYQSNCILWRAEHWTPI